MAANPAAAREPLGWGPFVVEAWTAGESIRLARNPAYFRASEGLPRLQTLIFRFVPDPAQAVQAALAGECDAVLHDSFGLRQTALLPLIDTAVNEGTLAARFQADTAWEHLDFNLTPAGERAAFFAELPVRQAVAHCLNRPALADGLYPGHGAPAYSLVPPDSPYFWPEAADQYPHDPNAGRAALAQAGWLGGGGTGEPPAQRDGVALEVELTVAEGDAGQTLAGLMSRDLEACGFGVTPRYATQEELSGVGAFSPLYIGSYDLAAFAWRGGPGGQPQCDLYTLAETPSEETGWQGANISGYGNAAYDAVCAEALRAGPQADGQAAHWQAQRLLWADLPALPLFHRVQWLVARPPVTGLSLEGIAADELRSELIDAELLGFGG
jgi:peptide/nickel transport system substrate-binding protein